MPNEAGDRPTTGAQHCFRSKSTSETDCPDPLTQEVGHPLSLRRFYVLFFIELERVLRIYTAHYNRERPHRGLALLTPDSARADPPPSRGEIKCRDRLGGLIHEYHRAAA